MVEVFGIVEGKGENDQKKIRIPNGSGQQRYFLCQFFLFDTVQ